MKVTEVIWLCIFVKALFIIENLGMPVKGEFLPPVAENHSEEEQPA